jgi:hypothetical protein
MKGNGRGRRRREEEGKGKGRGRGRRREGKGRKGLGKGGGWVGKGKVGRKGYMDGVDRDGDGDKGLGMGDGGWGWGWEQEREQEREHKLLAIFCTTVFMSQILYVPCERHGDVLRTRRYKKSTLEVENQKSINTKSYRGVQEKIQQKIFPGLCCIYYHKLTIGCFLTPSDTTLQLMQEALGNFALKGSVQRKLRWV